jgi:hypothetical protein
MTQQEIELVRILALAWDAFLALPVDHCEERTEFRRLIHAAQDMIAARPTYRNLQSVGARI